jgi:small redox-active disulfide protein 2
LADNARTAAEQLGIDYELAKVTDITEIMKYGIMMTPGLVIDGHVVSSGKVPTTAQIVEMLRQAAANPTS